MKTNNNSIIALTDYKGFFGSKWKSDPYRSGFDKELLTKCFKDFGYELEFMKFNDISFNKEFWKEQLTIYTSSEDKGSFYKNYIEDVIFELERLGANLIPKYDFLKAHNNKVSMEMLRNRILEEENSKSYGTLEELINDIENSKINFPIVIKKATGSMSRGVFLAKSSGELIKYAKKISKTSSLKNALKEEIRTYKHKGYLKESPYQGKFIIQPFIPNLKNDWKVLVYANHYYILNRGIKENDFRASGSHYNYKAGSKSEFPIELLDEVHEIYLKLNVPHLSLDLAYDGHKLHILEFQTIYFGTSTMEFCDGYYTKENGEWLLKTQKLNQEEEFTQGIIHFLKNR